jgi:hypothetical protein
LKKEPDLPESAFKTHVKPKFKRSSAIEIAASANHSIPVKKVKIKKKPIKKESSSESDISPRLLTKEDYGIATL